MCLPLILKALNESGHLSIRVFFVFLFLFFFRGGGLCFVLSYYFVFVDISIFLSVLDFCPERSDKN